MARKPAALSLTLEALLKGMRTKTTPRLPLLLAVLPAVVLGSFKYMVTSLGYTLYSIQMEVLHQEP